MVDPTAALIFSIAAPRDRHDSVLREVISPIVAELRSSSSLDATYFERFNKPAWGLRLSVLGAAGWLEKEARPLVERGVAAFTSEFAIVPDDAEDKWVGGWREREHLKRIYHLDSLACLERIEAEVRGTLAGTRTQWSLLLVERLVDLFALERATRLEFYRRGFQWEVDLGRWDEQVLATLDRKFEAQADALAAALELRVEAASTASWGGPVAAGIALRLLDRVRAPVEALLAEHAALRLERDVLDYVVFAAHAHANRLGIHATQEATARYLVWRARGGRRGAAA